MSQFKFMIMYALVTTFLCILAFKLGGYIAVGVVVLLAAWAVRLI